MQHEGLSVTGHGVLALKVTRSLELRVAREVPVNGQGRDEQAKL